jgi:hypothetical protein
VLPAAAARLTSRWVAALRAKHLDAWLGGWAATALRDLAAPRPRGPRHLLFAVCDHFEPRWKRPSPEVAEERVRRWEEEYPAAVAGFRDADGRPPRHTFFFPGEEYAPSYLDRLASLARAGFGEVEVHLHHDGDTPEGLRRDLAACVDRFTRHGHLARDPDGRPRWAFIHGNWALANARRDGRWCGVDGELPILWEAGCYADFTFPSAPDECQPRVVNRIYWPAGDLARRRAYEGGERARVGVVRRDRILLVQGPVAPVLRRARIPIGIEAGDLTGRLPPTAARVRTWVRQNVHVQGRPEWVFVKVHTHGAQEANAACLLGPGARALHAALARWNDGRRWVLHYVTAREMFNVAMAAMDGKAGDPGAYRDYVLPPPPCARSGSATTVAG